MAINLFEKQCDKIFSKCSTEFANNSKGSLPSSLAKLTTNSSITNNDSKRNQIRVGARNLKSPYLIGDSVQFLPRVRKTLYAQHKKASSSSSRHLSDFASSFPLAASIYRANSDQIKLRKRASKKIRKSVLTLPNTQREMPQMCTVSDTNDSKIFDNNDDKHKRTNKRLPPQNRKPRVRNKNYDFYDRDARYCSQMNINLDRSSSDIISEYSRHGKENVGKVVSNKQSQIEREFNAHDIWTVLRNINRFQFRPSPPMSGDSVETVKKRKIDKRKNKRKDTSLIKTFRKEEFTNLTKQDVDSGDKTLNNISPSSSLDRITIIDKHDENCEYNKEIKKSILQASHGKSENPSLAVMDKKNMKYTKTIRNKEQEQSALFQNNTIPGTYIHTSSIFNNSETLVQRKNNIFVTHQKPKRTTCISRSKENFPEYNKTYNCDYNPQVKRKTTVIVKGQMNETYNNKPCIETTLPNCTQGFRMTQSEIKRRLADYKFPIVVLGKDQLCSSYMQATNHEPLHLQILDQHIWPFMQDWYEKDCIKNVNKTKKDDKIDQRMVPIHKKAIERKSLHKQHETDTYKQATRRDTISKSINTLNKKIQNRLVPLNESPKINLRSLKKSNLFHQTKDKMLKLLYKNPVKDIAEQYKMGDQADSSTSCIRNVEIKSKIDVATETLLKQDRNLFRHNFKKCPRTDELLVHKQTWSKALSASKFIDTVIKKIHKGVYYNQDNSHEPKITNLNEILNVGIQAISATEDLKINDIVTKDEIIQRKNHEDIMQVTPSDTNKPLPGFNEVLPVMEIKTLNIKEIAVKHTNIQIHFDIAIPSDLDSQNNKQKLSSLELLHVTGSNTTIYKSKTTIINAMLPAEICSLLPNIIGSISKIPVTPAISSSAVPFLNDTLLYTISELCHTESHDIFKSMLPPVINIPPKLLKLLNGAFYTTEVHKAEKAYEVPALKRKDYKEAINLFGKLSSKRLFTFQMDPFSKDPYYYAETNILEKKTVTYFNNKTYCDSLELYNKPNFALNTVFGENNKIMGKKMNQDSYIQIKMLINSIPLSLIFDGKQIIVKVTNNSQGFEENSSTIVSNLNLNISQDFKANSNLINAIEHKEILHNSDKNFNSSQKTSNYLKFRKNKYVKLFKKCKSASNISGEKNVTPLSTILNMEDFLQAMGTGKMLSSIFDGRSEKKILSSILQMKNWITEISQRQAMLVLLLINKKDTPNLVRYRPILLQGIAVHRITRASELDMEIEVIERENFNKSKLVGVPYLAECVENKDFLLEELYWIAKTTASDYQMPFNETSEKFLKSLLEKRKKLNPSYLRVMARYVGLGLLKSPDKKLN